MRGYICARNWKFLVLVLIAGSIGLGQELRPQGETPRQSTRGNGVWRQSDGTHSAVWIERAVQLPSGDPRRISLPHLEADTEIQVRVEAIPGQQQPLPEHLRVEILRYDPAAPERPSQSEGDGLRLIPLAKNPLPEPFHFQVPRDGHYMVVLHQRNAQRATADLLVQVRLRRPERSVQSRREAPAPYTLPPSARIAVAVFSAGLLWTTLLLCGAPIVRAFRSRRTPEEPPWFA